ncbi:hypothetical protein Bbelb_114230 [Branchiostoma belcheri]|nr:hypothetical protein Bbelb_114230 [Branchiostoma belcheri]
MKWLHVLCLLLILSTWTVAGHPYLRDDGEEGEEVDGEEGEEEDGEEGGEEGEEEDGEEGEEEDGEEEDGEEEDGEEGEEEDGEEEDGEEEDDEEGEEEDGEEEDGEEDGEEGEEEDGEEGEEEDSEEGEEEDGEEEGEEGSGEGAEKKSLEQEEEGSGESERRDSFLSDLQKAIDFENQFYRNGHLSRHESEAADAVREYIEFGKSWEAKKKGLQTRKEKHGSEKDGKTKEKRLAFIDDLLDTLEFEKQFYKKGIMSPHEEKAAKETREFLTFGQAWREKKEHGGQTADSAKKEERKLAEQLKDLLHQKDAGSAIEKKAEELFEILE